MQEPRLDRLERIAKLFVKAGLRQRRESRDQANKIDHLINHQISNESKFADQNGRINNLIDLQLHNEKQFADQSGRIDGLIELQKQTEVRFAQNEVRFARLAESQTKLAESQTNTDRRLDTLIEIVKEGRNGDFLPKT